MLAQHLKKYRSDKNMAPQQEGMSQNLKSCEIKKKRFFLFFSLFLMWITDGVKNIRN